MLSYSQSVLINEKTGDTMVIITIDQMDGIYIELLQKDSLSDQAIINASNELLLLQIVDSADRDIKSLKTSVNRLSDIVKDKDVKIARNRKISFVSVCVAILAILIR